tara:strand:+ start:72 stop:731 length:660 start_codon:yes stop_codon:yes gene_type:complete
MAVGATYLTLVNDVLARLRESSVTSVGDNSYSNLIGKFVNEAKREVEDAWNWNRLRNTITVDTVANTFNYTLTSSQKRFRVIDAFNDTQDIEMRLTGMNTLNQRFYLGTTQTGAPQEFGFNGHDSAGDAKVDVYPVPDQVYSLRFNLIIPQADLSADTDEIIMNEFPIILGAYAKAIFERGEDGGVSTNEAYQIYNVALNDAISQDAALAQDELVYQAV